ncbi:putative glutamate receptor [Tachypleus tridentatus]|uniref:putative glutamate receptor n=1 Tax=Tachypleus tridentatus TaxID=6853 RepID=UPI003FD41364
MNKLSYADCTSAGLANNFPFFLREINPDGQLVGKDGIDFRILQSLAQKYKFRFRITTPSDKSWGVKGPKGEWSGMLGMEADFALTNIGMTYEREEVVDFTYPYMIGSMSFVTHAPREKSRALAIVKPFSVQLWIAILISVVATSVVTVLLARNSFRPERNNWTLGEATWYFFGALTLQGGERLPLRTSTRLIVACYWLFAIIIVAGFSGSLTSFMNVPEKELPINTISELAHRVQNKQLKVGTLRGTLPYANFMSATEGHMYVIGKDMRKDEEETVVSDLNIGAYRVMEEKYAFVFPKLFMEGVLVNHGFQEYHFGKENFYNILFSIVMPKGSPLKEAFAKVLIRLSEMGLTNKWKQDIMDYRKLKRHLGSKVTSPQGVREVHNR